MTRETKIADGVVHKLPADLRKALISTPGIVEKWNGLTPLARNEWICWVESVKKTDTREEHVKRVCEDILNGKRRPCCWAGCKHRSKRIL